MQSGSSGVVADSQVRAIISRGDADDDVAQMEHLPGITRGRRGDIRGRGNLEVGVMGIPLPHLCLPYLFPIPIILFKIPIMYP